MNEKECSEPMNPEKLVDLCRKPDEESKSTVLNYLHDLFLDDFKKIFWRHTVTSTRYGAEEQLEVAFDDGSLFLYNWLKDYGWEERGTTVKAAVLKFCGVQLQALTKNLLRDKNKPLAKEPEMIIEAKASRYSTENPAALLEEKERQQWEEKIFCKAFLQLDEKCRDFILWNLKKITDEAMQMKYPDVIFSQNQIKKNREDEYPQKNDKELEKMIRKRYDIPSHCKEKLKERVDQLRGIKDKNETGKL